jgi:hypothetical protein
MIIISKSMLALSALMSAGIVAAVDISGTQSVDRPAAVEVADRFPVTSEMFTPVSMTQFAAQMFIAHQPVVDGRRGDKLPAPEGCSQQDWPYISHQCLVSTDGNPVKKVNRVITIERRVSDNTSELMRVPVADLAQR